MVIGVIGWWRYEASQPKVTLRGPRESSPRTPASSSRTPASPSRTPASSSRTPASPSRTPASSTISQHSLLGASRVLGADPGFLDADPGFLGADPGASSTVFPADLLEDPSFPVADPGVLLADPSFPVADPGVLLEDPSFPDGSPAGPQAVFAFDFRSAVPSMARSMAPARSVGTPSPLAHWSTFTSVVCAAAATIPRRWRESPRSFYCRTLVKGRSAGERDPLGMAGPL